MKKIPTNHDKTPDNKWPTPLLDKVCAEFDKVAVDWPLGLPKPKHFPATLKSFLTRIVKAKTTADGMARFRRFLGVKAGRDSHWLAGNPITADEREAWAISQIQAIKDGDKTGGFFSEDNWLAMGSAYVSWWQDQKSAKARESVNKTARVREYKKNTSQPVDKAFVVFSAIRSAVLAGFSEFVQHELPKTGIRSAPAA